MIKRLSACIREYKLPSILAPIFIAMEVILEVFIPKIMGKLMDNGIEKGDSGYVLKVGALLIVICLLSLFFGVAADANDTMQTERIITSANKRLANFFILFLLNDN